jgi:hypothetical protein
MWAAKGRFSQAIQDDDPISWDASSDGKFTLSLAAVSIQTLSFYSIFDLFLGQCEDR